MRLAAANKGPEFYSVVAPYAHHAGRAVKSHQRVILLPPPGIRHFLRGLRKVFQSVISHALRLA